MNKIVAPRHPFATPRLSRKQRRARRRSETIAMARHHQRTLAEKQSRLAQLRKDGAERLTDIRNAANGRKYRNGRIAARAASGQSADEIARSLKMHPEAVRQVLRAQSKSR